MTEEDRARLISAPKVLFLPLPDYQPATNSSFLYCSSQLFTPSGEIIPKLLYHYIFKVSGKGCNVKYTLQHLVPGADRRLFQLEVYGSYHLSHIEPDGTKWFGPHMYYKGRSRRTIGKFDCRDEHRTEWFRRFCRHTNIVTREQEGSYQRPLL